VVGGDVVVVVVGRVLVVVLLGSVVVVGGSVVVGVGSVVGAGTDVSLPGRVVAEPVGGGASPRPTGELVVGATLVGDGVVVTAGSRGRSSSGASVAIMSPANASSSTIAAESPTIRARRRRARATTVAGGERTGGGTTPAPAGWTTGVAPAGPGATAGSVTAGSAATGTGPDGTGTTGSVAGPGPGLACVASG
jgi:hypothetical protein